MTIEYKIVINIIKKINIATAQVLKKKILTTSVTQYIS